MIYQGNHVTIAFAQKISHSTGSFAKTGRAQCDRVFLHRYNALLCNVTDKFAENETICIIMGLDSTVAAAYSFIQWVKMSIFRVSFPIEHIQRFYKIIKPLFDWDSFTICRIATVSMASQQALYNDCSFQHPAISNSVDYFNSYKLKLFQD